MMESLNNISSTSEILSQSFSVIGNGHSFDASSEQSFGTRLPLLSSSPCNAGLRVNDGQQPAEKRTKMSTSLFPESGTDQPSTETLFKQQSQVILSNTFLC